MFPPKHTAKVYSNLNLLAMFSNFNAFYRGAFLSFTLFGRVSHAVIIFDTFQSMNYIIIHNNEGIITTERLMAYIALWGNIVKFLVVIW